MEKNISLICTVVATKNSENLLSANFDVLDALAMWETVFKMQKDIVFGVALIKTKDRGVGVNFKLKKDMAIDLDQFAKFEFHIGNDHFTGRIFVERGPPPPLGELVTITVSGFGFHLSLDEIGEWLALFGRIEGRGDFKDHTKAPVKTDTAIFRMRLRKHVPSVLPAYGRKMMVIYHGQPKVCGACFEPGHVRKDCTNERVDWMYYVKAISEVAPLPMLGKWGEILVKNPAYGANGMQTPAKVD